MEWFERDFDHSAYFKIHRYKEAEALTEGPALAALLDLPRGSRVLDLPSGWGRLSPALIQAGHRVAGGDLSPLNLQRHAREFPGTPVRLDLRRLPFKDACADGVLCAFTSWGYFASYRENQAQLEEFSRILRPGGALLLDLAGRSHCLSVLGPVEGKWREVEESYRERATFSDGGRRLVMERICQGFVLRHDVWLPTDLEVRTCLGAAGFALDRAFGDIHGNAWHPGAERWIYRALKV